MEDSHQDKKSEKLLRIHKFTQILYQELQSYGKTSQQTQWKKKWKWEEHQKAFKELKHVLQSIVSASAHLLLPMGSM